MTDPTLPPEPPSDKFGIQKLDDPQSPWNDLSGELSIEFEVLVESRQRAIKGKIAVKLSLIALPGGGTYYLIEHWEEVLAYADRFLRQLGF